MDTGLLFDIQRFSLHDGPGIRTTLFFKGCSLSCKWCQNPESHSLAVEMAFYNENCAQCFSCKEACTQDAIIDLPEARIDFSQCDACGVCADACITNSLRVIGQPWGSESLLEEVLKDQDFFADSGGGVTLSGGEPLLQAGFLAEFLPLLKKHSVHVTLETAGMYNWDRLSPLLQWIDLVYFDLKHLDSATHAQITGQPNDLILDNFLQLRSKDVLLQARMPLVPGMNDDQGNLMATAHFLRSHGQDSIHLLGYHRLGESKLARINSDLKPLGLSSQTQEQLNAAKAIFAKEGINANVYD